MKRHRAFRAISFALLLAAAACTDHQNVRPHVRLTAGAEPLRTQFNEDVGQVRMLMIVAPT
jgi:hypothetical protein